MIIFNLTYDERNFQQRLYRLFDLRVALCCQHGLVAVQREEMASVLADGKPYLLLIRVVPREVGEEIAGAVLRGGHGVGHLGGGRERDADGAERGESEFAEGGGTSSEGHGRSPVRENAPVCGAFSRVSWLTGRFFHNIY